MAFSGGLVGAKIKSIKSRQVLDSRGNPTVEVELSTNDFSVSSIVPSGASTGKHEALELRDGDKKQYNGKGVLKAVSNVNNIITKKLVGFDCEKQAEIDSLMIELDGTETKSKLGANSMLAVSMAVCKAGAKSRGLEVFEHISSLAKTKTKMPVPQMNVINSGKHAGVDNDIQEHMILPVGFKSFAEALRAGTETYHTLKSILHKKFGAKATLLGDEGGFAPSIESVHDRLELLMQAIEETGYSGKIKLGLDCASSEFFNGTGYTIMGKKYSKEELVDFYNEICSTFPIITIEDGFSEDDFEGWNMLNSSLGKKVQLVGDDLLVTNIKRIGVASSKKLCNALLLKVNQIGTVTESIEAAKLSYSNNWNVVVSHRSGETEDSFISDVCVGLGARQSKFGAPARSERTAKYNQLLRIEEKLKNR
jgi:enolase